MQDELEVAFCDLCNTSVPLQDLEAGKAVRHGGKTIGACCLPALQRAGEPVATAKGPASAAAAPSDNRLLTVAFVLLAAVAAATIYLENRISERVDQARTSSREVLDQLDRSVNSQDDLLRGLDEAMAATAKQADLARVETAVAGIDGAIKDEMTRRRAVEDRQQTALGQVDARLQSLLDARAEQKQQLALLQQQLLQQSVTLAELRALPRPAPKEASAETPAVPAEVVAPGLPPELQHQVARLGDPDPATRFEAVDELLRSKNADVREHLLPMAKDADTFVRRLTVEGLREFKHGSSVAALLVALGDTEEIVRDTAWRSLKELTGQKLPFEASASKEVRARMQRSWQDWWDKNQAGFGG